MNRKSPKMDPPEQPPDPSDVTWDPEPRTDRGDQTVNTWDPILGEPVNVPGHPLDREPDCTEAVARRLALAGEFDDLDDDQPLPLLESKMRTDPVEGTQGSYSVIHRLEDDQHCPGCGSEYAIRSGHTLAGIHAGRCLLCDLQLWDP